MEAEEEDVSKVSEPSLTMPQDDDAVPLAHTGEELQNTKPQCDPESAPEPELKPDPEGFGLGVEGESDLAPSSVGRGGGDGVEGQCEEGDTDMKDVAKAVAVTEDTVETDVVADLGVAKERPAADVAEGTSVADLEEKLVVEEETNVVLTEVEEERNVVEGLVKEETEVEKEIHMAVGHVTEETEVVEEMNVAYGHVTAGETEVVEEINVAGGHVKEMNMAGGQVTGEAEVVEEMNVTEGHLTEETGVLEEMNVAEGHMTEETEVRDVDGKALGMEGKVLAEASVVARSAKEEGEESNVPETAEETVLSWKDQAEEAEAVVEGEESGAKVEGEEAEADAGEEGEEAEVEGDDKENVADMVAEADVVEEVDMADDVMKETTEADETEAAVEEAEGMAVEEEEEEETNKAGSGGKRKCGKSSKVTGKILSKKKMEEDVCFICFDGGELVLCDRRGCPKAYHPSCVNRDEAFFRAKGRWNCGWHLCSNCEKNAHYVCYTCTFSLCKGCIKDAVILCVRGNKGFCETCMKTVMLIEKNGQGNKDMDEVDFDDKSCWEYLFKDYWIDLKERLSLTVDELAQAKNPWKGAAGNKQESRDEPYDVNNDEGSDSENSENLVLVNSKKRKAKKRLRTRAKGRDSSIPATETGSGGPSADDSIGWASKELLEFVLHMRSGDKSALSQFDVQALLLEYIKRNKLRDPRRKSQIVCDIRLQNLFGKPRVGHFEMLKLLESHFLIKEDSQADDLQGSVVDTEGNQLEADESSDTPTKASKDKRRKTRKKSDGRGQSNIDDFAAINMHNINLIYLRRNLVEDLLDDLDNFQDKVAKSFVRIRISGSGQKQDLYRLVQVKGTIKAATPYKVGKKVTDILLEISNLSKPEIVSMDIISNQEFTEDECMRLRQSIKCGLIERLTVGDVQEKALVLQAVRVKDWLETEIVRLSHLRDRASEKGRRKELRECVEKLQLLKTPEERQRRLEETVEIHADPNMDPSYESEEDEDEGDDKRRESYMRPTGSGFGRKGREPISPGRGGSSSNDSRTGTRNYSNMNRELSRNMSNRGFFNKAESTTGAGEIVNDSWGQGRDTETQQTNHWEKKQNVSSLETGVRSTQSVVPSESSPAGGSENSVAHFSTGIAQSAVNFNESEKLWHYKDPSGKVQGPFSMVQLRKWNNTGYFPANLRVWKNTEKEDDFILVTDAIAGKFQKEPLLVDSSFPKMLHDSHLSPVHSGKPQGALFQRGTEGQAGGSWGSQNEINSSSGRDTPSSVEVPKFSADAWGKTNLPSPTPSQTPSAGAKGQAYESNWSRSPVRPAGSVLGGNGVLQPTAVVTPESAVKYENGTDLGSTNALQMHGQVTGSAPILANASMNQVADVKNLVSNLQNLVQSVTSRTPAGDTRGWGTGSVAKQETTALGPVPGSESQAWGGGPSQRIEPNNATTVPAQHPPHGYWSNAPSTNNATSSINTGNSAGNFPTSGYSGVPHSDPWRAPVPSNQSYIQPPAQPQVPWGVGVPDKQSFVPRTGQENQNTSWAPMAGNPNVTWGGPVPGNTNMNWRPPGQGPGWTAPSQGPVPGNAPGQGWVPPGQGPPSVSANPGWAQQPGQAHGNANPGWGAPTATPNGERFSNQRDCGSHGGDSGFGGGKPWNNRQSSFGGGGGGGGSSRPPFKGQRVCRFFESGHCKKGAACDYLHPDH